jgi:hypothetical protein
MKTRRLTSTIALLGLALAVAPAAAAQTAAGSYRFTMDDRLTKYVEFDAQALAAGGATGRMFFSDESEVAYQDVDGVGDPVERHQGFYLSADLDQMSVSGNKAVMGGVVRDASITSIIGRRVLLTVEDKGADGREPDRLTWGVYQPAERRWTPSDAEREPDPGVGATWVATDAERRGDAGIPMPQDESVGAQTYPFAAYAYVDTTDGVGDIVVRP